MRRVSALTGRDQPGFLARRVRLAGYHPQLRRCRARARARLAAAAVAQPSVARAALLAAMSRELKTWVSDQLHTLVGFSEATLADYVCGMASKQRSVQGLLTALHEAEVPDNVQEPASTVFSAS